jgi:hypothetical protein
MFEVLHSGDLNVLSNAVYLIGLRMREREYYPDWRRWMPLRSGDGHRPQAYEVAVGIIEEIEIAEGRSIAELSDRELDPYVHCIHEILRQRRAAEHPNTEGVGERILAELRRDYGLPEWRAVA